MRIQGKHAIPDPGFRPWIYYTTRVTLPDDSHVALP